MQAEIDVYIKDTQLKESGKQEAAIRKKANFLDDVS